MDEQNIDFYTKEEVNELLDITSTENENEMSIDFYTKTEVDELIAGHSGEGGYVADTSMIRCESTGTVYDRWEHLYKIGNAPISGLTIDAYVYMPSSETGVISTLSNIQTNNDPNNYNPLLLVGVRPNDSFKLMFGSNDTSVTMPTGRKVGVTAVLDSISGRIYIDGELAYENTNFKYNNFPCSPTTAWIQVGRSDTSYGGSGYSWYGTIYAYRAYSRALTAAEIAQNHAQDIAIFGTT